MTTLCPICTDWPIEGSNLFCGGCGAFIGMIGSSLLEERDGAPWLCIPATPDASWANITFQVFEKTANDELPLPLGAAKASDFPDGMLVQATERADTGTALIVRAMAGIQMLKKATNILGAGVFGGGSPVLRVVDTLIASNGAQPLASGWVRISVRIRNLGASVILSTARLELDNVAAAEDQVPDEVAAMVQPVLLVHRGEVAVQALLSPGEFAELAKTPRTFKATFVAKSSDGKQVRAIDRPRIYHPRPPSAEAKLALIVRARAEQLARVGASIVNTGGTPLSVAGITLSLDGKPLAVDLPFEWSEQIEPGAEVCAELRPQIPADAGGFPTLKLTVTFAPESGTLPPAEASRQMEITPKDAIYSGYVCIDFGTSESGASAAPGNGPAEIIELGRVPLDRRPESQSDNDRAGRFLPTVVAILANGELVKGPRANLMNAAHQRFQVGIPWPAGLERPKKIVTEFKWGAKEADQLAVTTAFLGAVRDLVENHPAIAARISRPETLTYATKPTRFGPAETRNLLSAFEAAGFGDVHVDISEVASGDAPANAADQKILIAESWSPLDYVLEYSDEKQTHEQKMAPLDRMLAGYWPLPDIGTEGRTKADSAWIITCDVGAGSADLSVFEIDSQNRVTERDFHTDTTFAGNGFRDHIAAALLSWIAKLREIEEKSEEFLALKKAAGATEDSPPDAQRDFKRAIRAFQFNPGLLSHGDIQTFLRNWLADLALEAWPNAEKDAALKFSVGGPALTEKTLGTLREDLRNGFADVMKSKRTARSFVLQQLPLELPVGADLPMIIDLNTLPDLFAAVTMNFLEDYFFRLLAILAMLRRKSGMDANLETRKLASKGTGDARVTWADLVRIVPSGRGAAFPLANALIRAANIEFSLANARIAELSPVASKSITSWGGLEIAKKLCNPNEHYQIDISQRPLEIFLIVSGRRREPMLKAGQGAALRFDTVTEFAPARLRSDRLQVEERTETAVCSVPPAARTAPEEWWLAAASCDGMLKAKVLRATSGEAAVQSLLQENVP